MTDESTKVALIRRHVGVVAEFFRSFSEAFFPETGRSLARLPFGKQTLKNSSPNHVRARARKMLAPVERFGKLLCVDGHWVSRTAPAQWPIRVLALAFSLPRDAGRELSACDDLRPETSWVDFFCPRISARQKLASVPRRRP